MDAQLASSRRFESDKVLTKTMINNYAKNKLLPPPVKKKYSPEHMMLLVFIYYFKNILSITDIQTLLAPITDRYFGTESGFSIKDIYDEIFQMEKEEIASVKEDLLKKRMYPSPCSAAHRRRTGNFSSSFRLSVC
mgnify:CR=1 FL=1